MPIKPTEKSGSNQLNKRMALICFPLPNGTDFTTANFPFGIFSRNGDEPKPCSAIGDFVVDLSALQRLGYFSELALGNTLEAPVLNPFIALGKPITNALRKRLIELFTAPAGEGLSANIKHQHLVLHPMAEVQLHLPLSIPNYTDFYSSIDHATNVGKMFRDPANALLPNWKHIPIGYHGRASSITVSGTSFHRPNGQTKAPDAELPTFGPSKALDFELEMAFVVGRETALGETLSTAHAEASIFGLMLFNDWSARDIQTWEYVPLGPFLAKNFCSTISPWIVTLEALEPFRVAGPQQDPPVLPYLRCSGNHHFDVPLEVSILPEGGTETVVCKSNYRHLYWNLVQQLVHHTSNGCNLQVGDVYASGTISGPDAGSFGSMLEITWRGANPIDLADGSSRKFIQDGDTVTLRARAGSGDKAVGFGVCSAKVLPAKPFPA